MKIKILPLCLFAVILSYSVIGSYVIQWSYTSTKPSDPTTYCAIPIKSGTIPTTETTKTKAATIQLYNKLFGDTCLGPQGGTHNFQWIGSHYSCTDGETFVKQVIRDGRWGCNSQVSGQHGPQHGTWDVVLKPDDDLPVTAISSTGLSNNVVSFKLSCSDNVACKDTFYQLVDTAISCPAQSMGYTKGTTGQIDCSGGCKKKVCLYSTDTSDNSEKVRSFVPKIGGTVSPCSTDGSKLFCTDNLACSVKASCGASETQVVKLNSSEDSLVALSSFGGTYPYSLCCSLDSKRFATASSGGPEQYLFAVSEAKDALVSRAYDYGTKIYFPPSVSCYFTSSSVDVVPPFEGELLGKDFSNPLNIASHDYQCFYSDTAKIAECCGGSKIVPLGHCNSTLRVLAGVVNYGGVRKIAGQSFTHNITSVQENVTYCTTTNKFDTDLDNAAYGNWSCDSTINPKAQFRWTGHYCCSEADDKEEFYSDKDGLGICYNKTFVPNNGFLQYGGHTYDELYVKNGTIQGCAIQEDNPGYAPSALYTKDPNKPYNGSFTDSPSIDNDWLLQLRDYPNSKSNKNGNPAKPSLIKDYPYCATTGPKGNLKKFFCSYKEVWTDGLGKNRTHLSYIAWDLPSDDTTQRAECCEASKCWDGKDCVENYAIDASKPSLDKDGKNLRCMNGIWDDTPKKYNWDKKYSGFCPTQSQCLVDPKGKFANNGFPNKYGSEATSSTNPQCINNTQYIADHFCDNGNWTTRTKLLVAKLLGFAGSSDFTLFCDAYDISLNQFNYNLRPGSSYTHKKSDCTNVYDYADESQLAGIYFGNDRRPGCYTNCTNAAGETNCANNFCVLHITSGTPMTIIGTTLNQPINSPYYPFTDVLGIPASSPCNVQKSDDNYYACPGNANVMYNPKLQTVVFSTKSLSGLASGNAIQKVKDWLHSIIVYMTGSKVASIDQFPFVSENQQMQRVYADKHSAKQVFGVLEENIYDQGTPNTYLYLNYQGFNVNICQAFNASLSLDEFASTRYTCEHTGTSYRIVGWPGSSVFSQWQDFTAKLRVS